MVSQQLRRSQRLTRPSRPGPTGEGGSARPLLGLRRSQRLKQWGGQGRGRGDDGSRDRTKVKTHDTTYDLIEIFGEDPFNPDELSDIGSRLSLPLVRIF
jgi:hypothetical protein